jgi:hypothetical protein
MEATLICYRTASLWKTREAVSDLTYRERNWIAVSNIALMWRWYCSDFTSHHRPSASKVFSSSIEIETKSTTLCARLQNKTSKETSGTFSLSPSATNQQRTGFITIAWADTTASKLIVRTVSSLTEWRLFLCCTRALLASRSLPTEDSEIFWLTMRPSPRTWVALESSCRGACHAKICVFFYSSSSNRKYFKS